MPDRVRLVHKTLLDGRYHVFTSPDVRGLHISMNTLAAAQREAIAVLDQIARDDGSDSPVVDFIFEPVPEAA